MGHSANHRSLNGNNHWYSTQDNVLLEECRWMADSRGRWKSAATIEEGSTLRRQTIAVLTAHPFKTGEKNALGNENLGHCLDC
jgi:hypothetical protein